jgi:hypothetical protein
MEARKSEKCETGIKISGTEIGEHNNLILAFVEPFPSIASLFADERNSAALTSTLQRRDRWSQS